MMHGEIKTFCKTHPLLSVNRVSKVFRKTVIRRSFCRGLEKFAY